MRNHGIFDRFDRVESVSDGLSVFDFLGGAINAAYKQGWEKNVVEQGAKVCPGYPALSEWTVDWVASVVAATTAGNTFKVVELGAGYGQWLVSSIMAYKALNQKGEVFGLAVEADSIHYEWLQNHVESNLGKLNNVQTLLIQAAAGLDGTVEFPVVEDPSKNYGASYSLTELHDRTISVNCLSLSSIYAQLPNPRVDLLHVDIQGAEQDLISHAEFTTTLSQTRYILFGTHRTDALHEKVKNSLIDAGFEILVEWPRNTIVETSYGPINTNDGALFAVASSFAKEAHLHYDFSQLVISSSPRA